MIKFDNVEKPSLGYELIYRYVRVVHNYFYYRQYQVRGIENLPAKGEPFMVICNHQNGLNDALGILFAIKDGRHPVFIARADIFKKEFVAKLLRFIKIMPAFRAQDTGKENLGENEAIFNRSAEILEGGGIIAMFPEAGHEDCHHLGTFKKGFSRIAFKAVEASDFNMKLKIVPMSNHYSNYFSLQSKLAITIGKPFTFEELYDLYKEQPQRANVLLCAKARERVQAMMLDIKDKEYYGQYDLLRRMYGKRLMQSRGKSPFSFTSQLDAEIEVVNAIDHLRNQEPMRWEKLMNKVDSYGKNIKTLDLRDWIFRKRITLAGALLRTLWVILLFPVCLFGYIMNFLPYKAGNLITRNVKDRMLHSSFHLGLGALVTFPLWYTLIFALVWGLTGIWWVALIVLGSLPMSLVLFFRTKIFAIKLYNRVRRFRFLKTKNPLFMQTQKIYEEIMDELDALILSKSKVKLHNEEMNREYNQTS